MKPETAAGWEVARIRFKARVNPKATLDLDPSDQVSFVPMEAVGDDGSLVLDRTRPVAEVSQGYTYFENGDVSIAKITPCFENGKGAVMDGLVGGAGFGTTELIVLRPEEDVSARFLYYVTQSDHFRRQGEAAMLGSGGQKRVSDLFVKDFATQWPARDLQVAIAAYLDAETARIDELIEAKTQLMDLIEESRLTSLGSALGGHEGSADLVPTGSLFWSQRPAHWRVMRVKFLVDRIEQGWSPQAESGSAGPEEWGVLKAGACNGGVFRADENKTLPTDVVPDRSLEIRPNDILMSRGSGSADLVGSVAQVPSDVRSKLMLCDLMYRLTINTSLALPEWFALAMNSAPIRRQIRLSLRGAEGLTRKISVGEINELVVLLPPLSEQGEIVSRCRAINARALEASKHVNAEIELLRELRSATITDAVLGRINVRSHTKN